VAKEEVVARKETRTENQTVEADLRRERLEVDRSAETLRSSGTADRDLDTSSRGGQGLGDKLRNAADDLKDRIDGNPASRPGRDATDNRL